MVKVNDKEMTHPFASLASLSWQAQLSSAILYVPVTTGAVKHEYTAPVGKSSGDNAEVPYVKMI